MALPNKFSIAKPVEVVASGGHLVRPVDVNGVAIDDGTTVYSVAHPVVEVDTNGSIVADGSKIFSTHKKVTVSPIGTPIVTTDPSGSTTGVTLGGGSGSTSTIYDASIGQGVDPNGFAYLPLRSGANRYYVNSSTGNDTTGTGTAAAPYATIAKAATKVVSGNGDQILIAQGTTYSETLPNMTGKNGYSPLYPTVIQSYNPSAPTDETQMGRTGASRPVVNTGGTVGTVMLGSGNLQYLAVRGIDVSPGNIDGAVISFNPSSVPLSYILFENCILRYTFLDFANNSGPTSRGVHIVVRNCSSYGQWSTSGHSQGIYTDLLDGVTVEDSVFWHNGWRIGAIRLPQAGATISSITASGTTATVTTATAHGLTTGQSVTVSGASPAAFNTTAVLTVTGTTTFTYTMGSAPGANASPVGSYTYTDIGAANIFNHPLYLQDNCKGVLVRRNVFIDTSSDGGQLKSGGIYNQNFIIRCAEVTSLGGGDSYVTDQPGGTYVEAAYNFAVGSGSIPGGALGWGMHTSNNVQGSSVHHNALVRNDQTLSSSYAWLAEDTAGDVDGLHAPDYTDFHHNVSYLWNTSGHTTDFTNANGTLYVTTTNNVWDDPSDGNGNVNVGSASFPNAYTEASILGALPKAYASETAAINDWIANPEQHGWRNAARLGLVGYGVDVTNINLNTTAPTLSSGTAADIDNSTGTLGLTTDTANGHVYWVLLPSNVAPTGAQVKAGADSTGANALKSGYATVTTAGAQSISLTNLTPGTTYYAYAVHEDRYLNLSAPLYLGTFATTNVWSPLSLNGNGTTLKVWVDNTPSKAFVDAGVTPVGNGQTVQQVNDQSGNAYNLSQATAGNRPTWHSTGGANGNGYFTFASASSQTIYRGTTTVFDGTGQFLLGVMARATTIGTLQFPAGAANTAGGRIGINTDGTEYATAWMSSGSVVAHGTTAMTAGTWHRLIMLVTSTGGSGFGQIRMWLDGVETTPTNLTAAPSTSGGPINMGSSGSGLNPFNGDVAAAIWAAGVPTNVSSTVASLDAWLAAL